MRRAALSMFIRVFVSSWESNFLAQNHKATKIFDGRYAAGDF